MNFQFILFTVSALASQTLGLDNGLARTPPMGWLSWERFRCRTDCKMYPNSCINEKLYMDMADRLSEDGYLRAGYKYVNIDDCWATLQRDPKTLRLVPDPVRFPSGLKKLADYVHSKGLKLGIYGDMGTKTCGGYPGSKFTMELDAQTFAEWGIDSFKMDGCYSTTKDFSVAYPIMEFFLNKTGRPILFSCSWPAYMQSSDPDYKLIAKHCNIWRNYNDITDSWDSVKTIIKYYGDDKYNFSAVAGPGNFNDPDMIIVGNTGLSYQQWQVQMAMWAMMAAPLFLSEDLRTITPEARTLIQNPGVIAINQDRLGIMGKRVWQSGNIEAWIRPVTPVGSYAVAVLNLNDGGAQSGFNMTLVTLGVKGQDAYNLSEVFSGKALGKYTVSTNFPIFIDTNSVLLLKYTKLDRILKW
ncbi:hypothetical protein EGW08_015043 [Elysia chlorotica]|uniref:Alpha-galactosidase n=1 Tax=Elysia chlorotica TaxID=188477 RepID=A0A433T6G7_ELYCH|nr:hypothetical protein EGW08_015043 [Elysia chlorotica]